ncbi:Lrp/AsnC family transcriptional regulator [Desulfoplanes sp. PS50]|jgi:Lrp/AsnC family leucine-responsive transcriptional regulator
MIDSLDAEILNILQKDGRVSNAEMARELNMAPSAILERKKKLERAGIIKGYEVRLDAKALGLPLTVFIQVKTEENVGKTTVGYRLADLPNIQTVHFIAGEYSYMLQARLKDTDDLVELLKSIGNTPEVSDTRTILVLEPIKESLGLPIKRLSTREPGHRRKKPGNNHTSTA